MTYPNDFKKDVVSCMFVEGVTARDAASRFGIAESTAAKWRDEVSETTPLPEVVDCLRKVSGQYAAEKERGYFLEQMMESFAAKHFAPKLGQA